MGPSKKAKDTPAEQLLRMIEGPQPVAAPAKGGETVPLMRGGDVWRGMVAAVRRRLMPSHREVDVFLWNLRLVQRILWVVLAGVGLYVVVDFFMVKPPRQVAQVASVQMPGNTASSAESVNGQGKLKPLSGYLESVQQRNPFTGLSDMLTQSPLKTTEHRLEELAKGLTVVGIDRGANPEAIIEDSAQQRTYFVKVGDELNGMKVKEISSRGVVITYEGQELVLQ